MGNVFFYGGNTFIKAGQCESAPYMVMDKLNGNG